MPSIPTLVQRHAHAIVIGILARRDDDDNFGSSFDDDWNDAQDNFNRSRNIGMIAAAVIGSIVFITFCVIAALMWHRYVRRRDALRRNMHTPIKTDVDAPPPYTFGQGYVSVPQNVYTGGLDVPLEPYGGSDVSHSHGPHSHSHDTSGSHSYDTSASHSGGTSSGTSGGGGMS